MDVDVVAERGCVADAPRGCRHSCRLTLWSIGRLISLFCAVFTFHLVCSALSTYNSFVHMLPLLATLCT